MATDVFFGPTPAQYCDQKKYSWVEEKPVTPRARGSSDSLAIHLTFEKLPEEIFTHAEIAFIAGFYIDAVELHAVLKALVPF